MFCPRLKHFRRINADGTIGICGHMIKPPRFESLEDSHAWTTGLDKKFSDNHWPEECVRCKDAEYENNKSIRQHAIDFHNSVQNYKNEYYILGGTLDSYCNSACLTCNANLSTRIANLEGKPFVNDNYDSYANFPQDLIIKLDLNGGEPAFSKNYQKILQNLPKNLIDLRINTNGSRIIPNLKKVLQDNKNLNVTITLSLDGVADVHDYLRWPIKWANYEKTVDQYLHLRKNYKNLHLNFWTTLSVLNLHNFNNIINFAESKKIDHSYAYLENPSCLSIKKKNWITLTYTGNLKLVASAEHNDKALNDFLTKHEKLRNINRIPTLTIY